MSIITKCGLVAATCIGIFAAATTPVYAAETAVPVTQGFLADVSANIDFLDRSSRLALDNSKDSKIRVFARKEAVDQTVAANALYDWSQGATADTKGAAVKTGPDGLQTGRSVAVDGKPTRPAFQLAPASQEDIDRLYGLSGTEFDLDYKARQLDALSQLATAYQAYIETGDDPTLKSFASKELPKINKQLVELRRL